jgi:hypothetical protein
MFPKHTLVVFLLVMVAVLASTGCRRGSQDAHSLSKKAAGGSLQPDATTLAAVDDGIDQIITDLKYRGYWKVLLVGVPELAGPASGQVESPFLLAQRKFVERAKHADIQIEVAGSGQPADAEFRAAHPADAVVKVELTGYDTDRSKSTRAANAGVRIRLRETIFDPKTAKKIASKWSEPL